MPDQTTSQRRLNLKFNPGVATDERICESAQVPGVAKVERLFPEETEPDLASLMVVDVNQDEFDQAVPALRGQPDVQYVEEPAPRKLIRPVSENGGRERPAPGSSDPEEALPIASSVRLVDGIAPRADGTAGSRWGGAPLALDDAERRQPLRRPDQGRRGGHDRLDVLVGERRLLGDRPRLRRSGGRRRGAAISS